jgi:hypothetical protein
MSSFIGGGISIENQATWHPSSEGNISGIISGREWDLVKRPKYDCMFVVRNYSTLG